MPLVDDFAYGLYKKRWNWEINIVKKSLIAILTFILANMASANIKAGYGYAEKVYLMPSGTLLEAKLDTGAGVSSLSAVNIKIYDKTVDNKDEKYVSFDVSYENEHKKDDVKQLHYDLPLKRVMKIKNRAGEAQDKKYDQRPAVMMPVCFDGKVYDIEVNLTDRTHFYYPLLLGRKALIQFGAVIDSGQKMTFKPSLCKLAKEGGEKNEADPISNVKDESLDHE